MGTGALCGYCETPLAGRSIHDCTARDLVYDERDRECNARALAADARSYAEALLAIVGQPWWRCRVVGCGCEGAASACPSCGIYAAHEGDHDFDCAWLIAATALGIA